ncbi:MAG TPA: tRNA 2-thiouridine(34) synthase MnmA [Myxococcota bacterium]|nr:tRNA 2-thiouridine(34) synthase MnmA [Myxococcota bacterium]HOA13572.1 tRNA 2-thiouridine(34) synthase MnmA [Myxococcota bacterium]HOH76752.1 tRNA 2-thiouridine(34) synthase MnmA [Myxococcota bacterium]
MNTAIAMSGGVDSSVAASILQEQGHNLFGVTFITGHEADADLTVSRAAAAATTIGIPHFVFDASDIFESQVIQPCADAYSRGLTPNPCAICNPILKFGALLDFCASLGADRLATGHYARILTAPDGGPALARGLDSRKDQSYFLFRVPRDVLSSVVFPLGGLTKAQVRQRAAELGLPAATSDESQDVCFGNSERPLHEVLREITDRRGPPGNVVSPDGTVLGMHDGIDAFTIGQRHGLRIATGTRAWVTRIDPGGDVVLSNNPSDLECTSLLARDVVIGAGLDGSGPLACKIRYAHRAVPCTAGILPDGRLRVDFIEKVKAVTPGQASVVYSGDLVCCGGWIE